MRRATLIPVVAAFALALAGTAGAATTSAAKHLRTTHHGDHGRPAMFANDANELELLVKITAVTPATPTTAGSLAVVINGQPLVVPLPAGTVLPASFVPNATVELKIEVEQLGNDNHGRDGGGGDD